MAEISIKRALIAVYDKTGIADFARALVDEFGVEIISTGGTAKHLKEAGIPVTMVEEVTGFPELLDGRVKTLHPNIHAGILADRDNPEHMRQLAEHGIRPIDMVVVNLYPFRETIKRPGCTFDEAIEMIDIGGPCMLRAAAKNHKHVFVICRPWRYDEYLDLMRNQGPSREDMLKNAAAVFGATRSYDSWVLDYMIGKYARTEVGPGLESGIAPVRVDMLMKRAPLRYGENPHQQAGIYDRDGVPEDSAVFETQLASAEMSYNNLVDADAARGLCAELSRAQQALWHRLIAGASPTEPNRAANMQPIHDEQITRRNPPHIQREGVTYFVTFRLRSGELSPDERDIVMDCCIYPDGKKVCLHAVVVMPDHVHLIFTPLEAPGGGSYSLGDILHSIKGVSARKLADSRGTQGPVWQDESFDRVIRDGEEFVEKLNYICENPVTAELPNASAYPWSICENDPGWSSFDLAAIIDLNHALKCYFDGGADHERGWHRLLAGATARADARVFQSPTVKTCVFVKHTNACGVGIDTDPIQAYRHAYLGDPNAAMGGILAVNFTVDAAFAEVIMGTLQRFKADAEAAGCAHPPQAFFVEVIVAPFIDDEAEEVIRTTKKWGERVRLLNLDNLWESSERDRVDFKRITGGMLVQTPDLVGLNEADWKVVTDRQPTDAELADLRLAWLVCKHTKSNAITLCKDGMLIGNGAGQMSRIMSCRIATWMANENGHAAKLAGAVAASDAFFPFRDGPDILADAGVTAIIQPGGSKRDQEVIAAANERGIAMIVTGTRHFRH